MNIIKKVTILVGVLIAGIVIGSTGYWFFTEKQPQMRAYQEAQKEQEQLESMVHSGKVLKVGKGQLTMELKERGREDVSKESVVETIEVTEKASIQEGMNFVKKAGEALTDLREYIEPGMDVKILVDNGEARALYFPIRRPETVAENRPNEPNNEKEVEKTGTNQAQEVSNIE
ncbi:MAG: hypothetical protein FH756_10855 [Firmicutes bacterium]|nr:hypothetical protein [Bacillota bacterium]